MHSYIINGGNRLVRLEKVKNLVAEFGTSQFDLIDLGTEDLPNIGIAEVREFQKMLSLAPAYE